MWEFIDKIIYINLEQREDRRKIMQDFFYNGKIPSDKIVRFPAIRRSKGYVGCVESHMRVIEIAKKEGWKNVLILEDDLEWLDFEKGYQQLQELVNLPQWDVIQLVGWYVKHDLPRIYHTLNAGAYLVNGHYFDTLLQNRIESYKKITSFEMLYKPASPYTADVYWNKLAAKDHWYGLYPCICHQVVSYSDNSKKTYRADRVHGIYKREDEVNFFAPIQNAKS